MVAPDHDGRLQFALGHQGIKRQAKLVPFAVAEPADARRQALKFHSLLRQLDPASEMLILRKHLQHQLICPRDIRSLARERRPAERAFAFAKERPNVRWHKSREVVSVLD